MPDPLCLLIGVNLILMVMLGAAVSLAICFFADARHWRWKAHEWRVKANVRRREAVAFRASVPPPTGYRDKLPYWDAYELNRFAEKTA